MKAKVELADGAYELVEMGDPVCGQAYCDVCGDCISCFSEDCHNAGHAPQWVIYDFDDLHPERTTA